MRVLVAFSLAIVVGSSGHASAVTHSYTHADRYAGCMFGETIPLMRRGNGREHALSIASDRCIAWSQGLSATDIRDVDVTLHSAIERLERTGF